MKKYKFTNLFSYKFTTKKSNCNALLANPDLYFYIPWKEDAIVFYTVIDQIVQLVPENNITLNSFKIVNSTSSVVIVVRSLFFPRKNSIPDSLNIFSLYFQNCNGVEKKKKDVTRQIHNFNESDTVILASLVCKTGN